MTLSPLSSKGFLTRNTLFILYYLVLCGIIFLLLRPEVAIPVPVRTALLFLALLPALIKPGFLPFCITCFVTVSDNAFSPILPNQSFYYLIIVFLFYLIYKRKSRFPLHAFCLYYLFLLLCLLHGEIPEFLAWWLIAIFLGDFLKERTDIANIILAFILASLILSALFLLYKDHFLIDYVRVGMRTERTAWTSVNCFGAVIAAGSVLAVTYLSGILNVDKSKKLTLLSIATLTLSIPTIGLNASRGALLAFIIPSALALLFSNIKVYAKILLILLAAILSYQLVFNNESFELLASRMHDDTFATGGSRTKIWNAKLSAFSQFDSSSRLFGIGFSSCTDLAGHISTHNDFLTAFIAYGILGLLLFTFLIAFPLFKAPPKARKALLILSSYMLVECLVLEPFFRGYLFFLMFYIFSLRYAIIERKSHAQTTPLRPPQFQDWRNRR